MTKILVTGGAGFIGSHLSEQLISSNYNVIIIDNFSAGNQNFKKLSNIKNVTVINADITDPKTLSSDALNDVEIIYHLAAMNRAPRSIENPKLSNEVNINATLNILEYSRRKDIRLIMASSSSVFGDLPIQPRPEISYEYKPLHPYGLGKLTSEYYLELYHNLYHLDATTIRYFAVYGPRQSPKIKYSAVIPHFINSFINKTSINIYGGNQTRNFTYVADTVSATCALLKVKRLKLKYNIGGTEEISIFNLFDHLQDIFGYKIPLEVKPMKKEDLHKSIPSMTNLLDDTNFKHQYNFYQGLNETVNWFKSNPNYFE